jgi:hypothetical protein
MFETEVENLNKELNSDDRSGVSMSASYVSAERPKYSTLAKNLRATQAAANELMHLSVRLCKSSKTELVNYLLSLTGKMQRL